MSDLLVCILLTIANNLTNLTLFGYELKIL